MANDAIDIYVSDNLTSEEELEQYPDSGQILCVVM